MLKRFAAHPVWLVGFRPFFTVAMVSGALLPAWWVLILAGWLPAPATHVPATVWHAHEMFFGFGLAVLGGFLLTASKNWVKVRGVHGGWLAALLCAWLVERVGMACSAWLPAPLFLAASYAYVALLVALVMGTLVRHRHNDTFRRENVFFLLLLPLLPVAKHLLLAPATTPLGIEMTVALFRLAFLLMLERTVTQFMNGAYQVTLWRHGVFDLAVRGLGFALVLAAFAPQLGVSALSAALALLLGVRFVRWRPLLAAQRLDLAVMFLGQLAIIAQLALEASAAFVAPSWVGALSTHVFAFGAIGLVVPSMFVRISKGHTGRKVVFDAGDRAALWLMVTAFALRIVATQLAPSLYLVWLSLAAACWFGCFATLAFRYVPFLWRPRVDGKEH